MTTNELQDTSKIAPPPSYEDAIKTGGDPMSPGGGNTIGGYPIQTPPYPTQPSCPSYQPVAQDSGSTPAGPNMPNPYYYPQQGQPGYVHPGVNIGGSYGGQPNQMQYTGQSYVPGQQYVQGQPYAPSQPYTQSTNVVLAQQTYPQNLLAQQRRRKVLFLVIFSVITMIIILIVMTNLMW